MNALNLVFEVTTDDEFSVAKQLDALNSNSLVECFKPTITLFCKFNQWNEDLQIAFSRIRNRCKELDVKLVAVCSPKVTNAITPQLAYRLVEYFGKENISVVFAAQSLRKSSMMKDGIYVVY